MERLKIPVDGDSERWLAALERGDEPVAQPGTPTGGKKGSLDLEALAKVREALLPIRTNNAAQLIRELRDASDH